MEEINPELLKYIRECRKLGYEDYEIRIPLLENGWELTAVQDAFELIKKEEDKLKKKEIRKNNKTVYVYKNTYTIHLDSDVSKLVEKRAKKNLLSSEEQISDIVRRSCASQKTKTQEKDNVEDVFLKLFSRKSCGRLKKAK